jgi:hypothetical protein
MKEKLKKIFAILLCLMFVGYLLCTGVYDLINTKDMRTVNVDECAEALVIEHSINGLIPVGKDHYYLGIDDDTSSAFIIKASNSWYKKNFNAEYQSLTPGGLNITTLSKRIGDYKVRDELASRVSYLSESNVTFSASPEYCLDMDYKTKAIGKLALLGLGAILAILIIVISKKKEEVGKPVGIIVLIVAVAFLVLLLKVII